jgi:hypothetical protein
VENHPNMNATLECKISEVNSEAENSASIIMEGSDEHLDNILLVLTPLKEVTKKLEDLNEALWENIGRISKEILKDEFLPQLLGLRKGLLTYVGALASSKFAEESKQAISALLVQYKSLSEIVSDIRNIIIADDEEFDNILNDLNNL